MFSISTFSLAFKGTTLLIDIAICKCYNACEKSLENMWGEGEGNTVEYFSC